ncbi:MAG: UDP-N-acetylglucosamine 2-epimerase [Bdellovibrionota bacterium]
MKTVGLVTVARSDFGIYRSILKALSSSSTLTCKLIVTGMHLENKAGNSLQEIIDAGYKPDFQVKLTYDSDTPAGIVHTMSAGLKGFADLFTNFRPDVLLVLGDRFEMMSAVLASLPFSIPVAHLHGGESSEGNFDEAIRHSITKMSHLHFPSTESYQQRIIKMGEEPWRVHLTGAPALDDLATFPYLAKDDLEKQLGLDLNLPTILATYHPVTFEFEDTGYYIKEFLTAIEQLGIQTLFTYPNADTHGSLIIQAIEDFKKMHRFVHIVPNLGGKRYFSLLRHITALAGNSSSGIIEAASFGVPVVNVGNRQMGRVHGQNVIDVKYDYSSIKKGLELALSDNFRVKVKGMKNPYSVGHAATKVVEVLQSTVYNRALVEKKFYDS